jgi:hypothetical protein
LGQSCVKKLSLYHFSSFITTFLQIQGPFPWNAANSNQEMAICVYILGLGHVETRAGSIKIGALGEILKLGLIFFFFFESNQKIKIKIVKFFFKSKIYIIFLFKIYSPRFLRSKIFY